MSHAKAAKFRPFEVLLPRSSGPALPFSLPALPGWAERSAQVESALEKACAQARVRSRRTRSITLELHYADGRVRRRSLRLERPTDEARTLLPAALGLLNMLIRENGNDATGLTIRLGRLVEGRNEPIRFERYLARRKAQKWQKVWERFARALGFEK